MVTWLPVMSAGVAAVVLCAVSCLAAGLLQNNASWMPQRVVRSPFLTKSLAFLALEVLGCCCSGTSPVIAGIRQGVWSWQSWKPNALNASATCVAIWRLLMSQSRTSRRGDASDDSPCGGSLVDYSVDWLFTLVPWLILTVWLLVID